MPIILLLVMFFGQNKTSAQLPMGTNLTPYLGDIYHIGGNIGIGTDTPEQLLHIYADINTKPIFSAVRLETIFPKGQIYDREVWDFIDAGKLVFAYSNNFDSVSVMTLTSAGQLSLGTKSPNYSAIMQLESTGKGLLIPRMTSSEKNAIPTPANGLLVYDTDLRTFSYYDAVAASWQNTAASSDLSGYLLINDFNTSVAGGITQSDTTNWNTAFSWGNHADAGYITADSQDSLSNKTGNISMWNNDAGYITDTSLIYLWQENGDNIYRNSGNVGIGTNIPGKPLEIYSVYNVNVGSFLKTSTIRLTNKKKYYNESKTHAPGPPEDIVPEYLYKWDIENANNTLNFKFIKYDPAQIGLGQNINPVTKITFSGNGTLTAAKFVGDGSGLTNIGLNGPLILDNDMEPWTNSGWRARLQSPLGTVWASTNKSNLGDYYLGLGMTNSGWYFMKRYENGDYNYVTVIREDGRIRCTEVVIETNEWKDNVFNKTYNLKSIEETEQYISQHGHLPDIPSEKEIIKNGLETSEMIKLQMQKIEELTLYIIEQNKRIKALEKKTGGKQ